MTSQEKIHAVKRVLKQKFNSIYLELINSSPITLPDYRLRETLRTDWATQIVEALEDSHGN